jgi:hypothetical protein
MRGKDEQESWPGGAYEGYRLEEVTLQIWMALTMRSNAYHIDFWNADMRIFYRYEGTAEGQDIDLDRLLGCR